MTQVDNLDDILKMYESGKEINQAIYAKIGEVNKAVNSLLNADQ